MKTERINSRCPRCRAARDPQDRYCRNCGRRLKTKEGRDIVGEIIEEMCEKYCKYPDIYDEEKEETPLYDAKCRECPLERL